jgi:hypothetical protein
MCATDMRHIKPQKTTFLPRSYHDSIADTANDSHKDIELIANP